MAPCHAMEVVLPNVMVTSAVIVEMGRPLVLMKPLSRTTQGVATTAEYVVRQAREHAHILHQAVLHHPMAVAVASADHVVAAASAVLKEAVVALAAVAVILVADANPLIVNFYCE